MRVEKTSVNGRRVVAFSSQHTVVLVIDWPEAELTGLLGFAVRRKNPDRSVVWLEGFLGFKEQPHRPGEPIASNEAPFQKMFWADYKVRQGKTYDYDVIPVYGQAGNLDVRELNLVPIVIPTETNVGQKHAVYFNRAVIASQAYVRNFGLTDPESDPRILDWLSRGLDKAIVSFIDGARSDGSSLDVAAYHLNQSDIIQALAKLGGRARVCLCWKKPADKKTNAEANRVLRKAGVEVFHREKVPAISHNKLIIRKDARGNPIAVLTGSANFTNGGVALQNNVVHIFENAQLSAEYHRCFEHLIQEDNEGLRELASAWIPIGGTGQPDIEVNFSPHARGERIDLDRYVDLVAAAQSSVFFATFRATDAALLTALAKPKNRNVVVQGLVDKVYEKGDGEVLLYHSAYQKKPDVVPATNVPRAIDPLTAELGRKGFRPIVHHKFIVLDFNTPDCAVITGSANYSKNSSEKNDENTLILHRDSRVAHMYFCEFFRIYEHYRARWFITRASGAQVPPLAEDESWTRKYYGTGARAKFLDALRRPA